MHVHIIFRNYQETSILKFLILIFLLISVCTSNKDGRFSLNASAIKINTISVHWKYDLEKCDVRFVLYWSKKGPVSEFAQHQKLVNHTNVTSSEITNLGNNEVNYLELTRCPKIFKLCI